MNNDIDGYWKNKYESDIKWHKKKSVTSECITEIARGDVGNFDCLEVGVLVEDLLQSFHLGTPRSSVHI
jgi:hypothetical protein